MFHGPKVHSLAHTFTANHELNWLVGDSVQLIWAGGDATTGSCRFVISQLLLPRRHLALPAPPQPPPPTHPPPPPTPRAPASSRPLSLALYHWRELPQVWFLSRQKDVFLSRQNVFVATKLLSRQTSYWWQLPRVMALAHHITVFAAKCNDCSQTARHWHWHWRLRPRVSSVSPVLISFRKEHGVW